MWVGLTALALGAEGKAAFLSRLLGGSARPATLEKREVALQAAGSRAMTVIIEAKLAQLLAASLAVIDLVDEGSTSRQRSASSMAKSAPAASSPV